MKKRVLIITYYWPPSGGSGVQRWLKFVKYLVKAGWEPFVFTPENPSFTIQDPSLQKDVPATVEVIKFPIWEPYQLFFKVSSLFGNINVQQTDFISTGKRSFFKSISAWIRGNLFIPDARVFWVKPSVEYLTDFIARNKIEKIITTGPPHSVHLIGLKLKEKNPTLNWIADLRDPWSEWDLLDTLSLTSLARRRHRYLEKQVLTNADRVITIAPYHVNRFEILGDRKVDLITNGFDEDDFKGIVSVRTEKFTIRHVGVVDELRDPRPVMEAVKEIVQSDSELSNHIIIEFIGKVNSSFKSYVHNDLQLSAITRFIDQVPHDQLLALYGSTDLQLLVLAHTSIAPGNLPGKFFEYLASGKPILGIGPVHGDAAQVLQQTHAGVIKDRNDKEGLKSELIRYYQAWRDRSNTQSQNIQLYSRYNLTIKLISILESL
ncbi:MAG TPA: glycosyltransferase family 4 protein [Cyclobacteriaceae bacterium]|nr:glycosyltransferase family 4 protein [Cyclobacteriaceae bacterium]